MSRLTNWEVDSVNYRFENQLCDLTASLREEQGKVLIDMFRKELSRFNLKRHKVSINAGMGSCCIFIEDRTVELKRVHAGYDLHGNSDVECTLRWLNGILDYEWAYLFDGVELT